MKALLPSVRCDMLTMIEDALAIADKHELWEVAIGLDTARLALGATRIVRDAEPAGRQDPPRR